MLVRVLALLRRRRPSTPPAVEPPRRFAHPATVTVPVEARPEQVFAMLAEPARMPDWVLQHVEWIGPPPGEFAEGVRFRQRIKLMGVPSEVRWTVAGVVPERAVWFEGTAPMGIAVGFYLSVAPAAGGSVVRFDGGVEGGSAEGPLGAMLARSVADAIRRSLAELGRVARTAEPRTPDEPVRWERTGEELDPRTPVIVGVGQVCDRSTEPAGGDPVSLAVRALRLAARDAGEARDAGADLLARADLVGYVASVSWQYPDGAALIAESLGARPAQTVQTTTFGGDGSLRLLNEVAAAIATGQASIALIGGAEAAATAHANRDVDWPVQPDGTAPTRVVGADRPPNNEPETAAGLVSPVHLYALIESALRGRLGLTPEKHLDRITRLWADHSRIAAANPYAWSATARTAAELAEPTAANRLIAAPYPKLLTANPQVNLATGTIVCSVAAARRAGIPQDRWVFPHAGAHATDEWYVSERADLAASPAIRAVGDAVLGHAGVTVADVKHLDLYACFPSAVQIAAAELGLPVDDPDRPLTVTGGLTFAGGPGNNYAGHAVANLVPLLRAEPDSHGLATAVGWYLTKHAATVLSARPPYAPFRDLDADRRRPSPPARTALPEWHGPAVLEACTIDYDRDGRPRAGIVTAITPAGDRVVLRTDDVSQLSAADPLGWQLAVTGTGFTVVDTTPADLPPPGAPPLTVEWHDAITVLRLTRPGAGHALQKAVDAFEADPLARVAIVAGVDVDLAHRITGTTKPLLTAREIAAAVAGHQRIVDEHRSGEGTG